MVLASIFSQATTTTSAATSNVTTRPLRREHPANALSKYARARDAVSIAGVTMPWRNRPRSSLKSDSPVGTSNKKRGGSKAAPLKHRIFTGLLPAGGFARRSLGRLLLGLEVLAGRLVDHLHRQPRLAAIVEAEQLDLDLVAFLDDVGGLLHAVRRELADVD